MFFLSNLPRRNPRRKATPYVQTATAPSTDDVTVSRTTEPVDHLTSPGTQTRIRGKLRKRRCPSSSPEVARNSNSDELPAEVSSLDENRDMSDISVVSNIPCSNQYQVLAGLDESPDDPCKLNSSCQTESVLNDCELDLNTDNNTMDNDSFLHPILVTKKKCFCNVCGKTFKMETSSHPEEKCEFCSRTFFNPTIQSRDYIHCQCEKMCGHCIRRMIPKQHSAPM